MLSAVADWTTEDITVDFLRRVQVLTVSGSYWSCAPDALSRALAANVGVAPDDVFAAHDRLVIVAPLGTFTEPADYRAWIDEGVSEAERETMDLFERTRSARIAADNIAVLAANAGLPTDAIMRAAMVDPETADAIMAGESLPTPDLVRIATALGVRVESLLSPAADGRQNTRG